MMVTEFDFILPRGLVDAAGNIHREGSMRLATAKDEMAIAKDVKAQDNAVYAELMLLARVITHLGDLAEVTSNCLENLFTLDLSYLRELYNRINQQGTARIPVDCPVCKHSFKAEWVLSGEF